MSSDIAISVKNLGKCYHIYDRPRDRLKQALWGGRKQFYRDFWALRDISFEVKKGEAIGIIGRNGSGKSTLLQLICQTLTPTSGQIEVNGRVAALLELGAGFNPEFTGRENVYMNGAIIGFTRQEIDERFDKIAAFADIGEFMEQPVRTYSSGMFVRLAFAVQACVDPDILIVDEALSVGDIFFQQKCAKRMQELRENGVTLVFVSHDMSLVRDLCESAVYLKHGHMLFQGNSTLAIGHYFQEGSSPSAIAAVAPAIKKSKKPLLTMEAIEKFKNEACWINPEIEVEDKEKIAKILAVSVVDVDDIPTMRAEMGDTVKFKILYQVFKEVPIHAAIEIKNRYDQMINSSGSYTTNTDALHVKAGNYIVFELELSCMMEAGFYTFAARLGCAEGLPNRGYSVDVSPQLGPLKVEWDYETKRAPWLGMFGLPCSARFISL